MPNLSVIIPVYNTEKYLRACIDSVINQTLSDLEIICINDCSSDKSLQILQEYAKKDNRIKIIDFKSNKGVSAARNAGISESTGEYIGFVDSDDYVDLDFFEKLYKLAIKENADISKGNIITYENNEINKYDSDIDKIKKHQLTFIHFWSAIYRHDFITKNAIVFPEGIKRCEDSIFETKAAIWANKFVIDCTTSYHYFKRQNSANRIQIVDLENLQNLADAQEIIFDLINSANIDKNAYTAAMETRYGYMSFFCSDKVLDEGCKEYLAQTEKYLDTKVKYKDIIDNLKNKNRMKIVLKRLKSNVKKG